MLILTVLKKKSGKGFWLQRDTVNLKKKKRKENQRVRKLQEIVLKRDFVSRIEKRAAKDRKWLSVSEESFHLYCSYKTRQEITQDAADEKEEVVLRMTLDSASGMSGISQHTSFYWLVHRDCFCFLRSCCQRSRACHDQLLGQLCSKRLRLVSEHTQTMLSGFRVFLQNLPRN